SRPSPLLATTPEPPARAHPPVRSTPTPDDEHIAGHELEQEGHVPEPQTPVLWLDTAGTQQGPEPWETVQARVAHAQIPPSTQVWWDGAPGWMPFDQVEAAPAPAPAPATAPTPAPTP